MREKKREEREKQKEREIKREREKRERERIFCHYFALLLRSGFLNIGLLFLLPPDLVP